MQNRWEQHVSWTNMWYNLANPTTGTLILSPTHWWEVEGKSSNDRGSGNCHLTIIVISCQWHLSWRCWASSYIPRAYGVRHSTVWPIAMIMANPCEVVIPGSWTPADTCRGRCQSQHRFPASQHRQPWQCTSSLLSQNSWQNDNAGVLDMPQVVKGCQQQTVAQWLPTASREENEYVVATKKTAHSLMQNSS